MTTDSTRTRVPRAIDGHPLRTELITAGDRTGSALALAQAFELSASRAEVRVNLTGAVFSPAPRPCGHLGPPQ